MNSTASAPRSSVHRRRSARRVGAQPIPVTAYGAAAQVLGGRSQSQIKLPSSSGQHAQISPPEALSQIAPCSAHGSLSACVVQTGVQAGRVMNGDIEKSHDTQSQMPPVQLQLRRPVSAMPQAKVGHDVPSAVHSPPVLMPRHSAGATGGGMGVPVTTQPPELPPPVPGAVPPVPAASPPEPDVPPPVPDPDVPPVDVEPPVVGEPDEPPVPSLGSGVSALEQLHKPAAARSTTAPARPELRFVMRSSLSSKFQSFPKRRRGRRANRLINARAARFDHRSGRRTYLSVTFASEYTQFASGPVVVFFGSRPRALPTKRWHTG